MTGTVKWFNNAKGYGFITSEEGSDIFVHYLYIISDKSFKSLKKGDKVTYCVDWKDDNRIMATNVEKVEG